MYMHLLLVIFIFKLIICFTYWYVCHLALEPKAISQFFYNSIRFAKYTWQIIEHHKTKRSHVTIWRLHIVYIINIIFHEGYTIQKNWVPLSYWCNLLTHIYCIVSSSWNILFSIFIMYIRIFCTTIFAATIAGLSRIKTRTVYISDFNN